MSDAVLSRTAGRLLGLLNQGERFTKKAAAARLGRDPRTITRLVDELREAGIPVLEEKQSRAKRFYLASEDQQRGLHLGELDEHALLALTVAVPAAQKALAGTSLEAPLERAFAHLLRALNGLDEAGELFSFDPEEQAAYWHFGSLAAEPPNPETFAALRRAIGARQTIRVDYVNKKGERRFGRRMDPLALAPVRGAWQLAAYCHVHRAVRPFNPVRMANVRSLPGRYFDRPEGFDPKAYFAGLFGALQGEGTADVRLHVDKSRTVYFESKRYHPSQRVERQPDGSLRVRYRVPGGDALDEVRSFVASWGPHVLVLEPLELATRLAEDAAETARRYTELDASCPG